MVACHPEAFADKSRFSMDWYYPVLAGPVRGPAARARLDSRVGRRSWSPGLGVRCVSDEPWVTGAETCELVMALDATGDSGRALEVFAEIQHLRDPGGGYWTGWQYANQAHFPAERSSWTAAAMILAADALSRTTPASRPVPRPPARPPGSGPPATARRPWRRRRRADARDRSDPRDSAGGARRCAPGRGASRDGDLGELPGRQGR